MLGDEVRENLFRLVFGTPVYRGRTPAQIVGRKALRKTIRTAIRVDEDKKAEMEFEIDPVLAKMALARLAAKTAALYKEAPFKSEAQRRKFYAMKSRGEISGATVKKWEEHTPKGKKLPERLHRKAAEEKTAIPLWLGTMVPGKSGLARVARATGWTSIIGGGALEAAKAPPPSTRISMGAAVDHLLEIIKEGIEFHSHGPQSTDKVERDVKKNAMKSGSDARSGTEESGTSGINSALISLMAKLSSANVKRTPQRWLDIQTTANKQQNYDEPEGPANRAFSGKSMEGGSVGGAGAHIQRGGV